MVFLGRDIVDGNGTWTSTSNIYSRLSYILEYVFYARGQSRAVSAGFRAFFSRVSVCRWAGEGGGERQKNDVAREHTRGAKRVRRVTGSTRGFRVTTRATGRRRGAGSRPLESVSGHGLVSSENRVTSAAVFDTRF